MLRLTGGEALVKALRVEDVRDVFGVVGGKLGPLLKAIGQEPAMRFTGVRHEAAASMMAAAVQAGTGRVAVAIAEMGPGALNLAAGLGVATNNRLPVVVITSNQHRAASYPHSGMFMDLDTARLMAPLVKWGATVQDGRRLPELVRQAFREALSGRPGPVHLDIPHDVLSQVCEHPALAFAAPPSSYRVLAGGAARAQDLAAAAQLLREARRPLIVAGGGVVASGAAPAVRELAQRLHAPVMPTQMALGVVPSDSAHFIGHGGIISGTACLAAMRQADVVLAVGCRFSSWLWDEHGPLVRGEQQLININTDPSALGHPARHAVAMLADAHEALTALLPLLPLLPTSAADPGWLATLRDTRHAHEVTLKGLVGAPDGPMHPAELALAIGRALPADAMVVLDGGHTSFWTNDCTPVHATRTHFHDPGMSQLGFGLPYAIALQQQFPQRLVVNITGDGAFGFTLQELDTARRLRLPVINIIHNNAAWGVIRAGQRRDDFELASGLEGTDYAAIARGFGCHGETLHHAAEVAAALQRCRDSGLPAVLDAHTTFVPHPAFGAFGSMNRYSFDSLKAA